MICQNCQSNVADDLVFCTECGSRLHETISTEKTVIMPPSVVTKVTEAKSNSRLKIATIIAGILALLTVVGVGALLLFNPFSPKPISQNSTPKPSRTPTLKPANQNKAANIPVNNSNTNNNSSNKNANDSNNENTEKEPPKLEKSILNERINIYADSSVAFPFTVDEDAKIAGKTEIVNGEQFEGYVFLQEVYDENGVKPEMKVFSFESGEVEQFLPKGNYVLVFANNNETEVSLKSKFTQIQQSSNPAK